MQRQSYGVELEEERFALESKVNVSRNTSCVIEIDSKVCGYIIALPYPINSFPEINSTETKRYQSDNLHIHDLSICAENRKQGFAKTLFNYLKEKSVRENFSSISIVSIDGAFDFWSKLEFKPTSLSNEINMYGD
ncbi:hypothetical protein C1141_21435, partial [Vibrio agarivorans]